MSTQRLSGEPDPKRKRGGKSGRTQRIVKCAKCTRYVYLCAAYGNPDTGFFHWECWDGRQT